MKLQDFKDNLAKEAYGMTTEEAWAKGICINCKDAAMPKCYSDAGRREYKISATCEKCFDEMFKEVE